MVASKTKYIGYGTALTSIIALLGWIVASPYFSIQMEGDKTCAGTFEDPCEWYYNITLKEVNTYYFQNKNHTNMVFVPDVKSSYNCKKDNRFTGKSRLNREQYPCGVGFREFNWSEPLTNKYGYVNKFIKNEKQEFKLVVFKNNPSDKIKFGGELFDKNIDPYFLPKMDWSYIQECTTITPTGSHLEPIVGQCRGDRGFTFINNQTGQNESRTQPYTYSCITEQRVVQKPEVKECRNIGISMGGDEFYWEPYNYRNCNVFRGQICGAKESQANDDAIWQSGEGWCCLDENYACTSGSVSATSWTRKDDAALKLDSERERENQKKVVRP